MALPKLKVLVVDDSGFFQRRVTEIINADARLEVIATASNGREGVEKALALKPDVITMDYEMPVMDGVTAVRNIMNQCPTPVLMFSSLTYEGARITLDALEAGAIDFLSKQFDAIAASEAQLHKTLTDKICEVAAAGKKAGVRKSFSTPIPNSASISNNTVASNAALVRPQVMRSATPASKSLRHVEVVIIGTSTGGPAALQTIFKQIPASFAKPIVIVQHMPGSFTKAFAERLNKLSPLTVSEAKQGDKLKPGHVYVAPGGMQLMVDSRNGGCIHIHESDDRISYRPSVDIALASAAKHFGRKALAVILTGMGSDGKEGAHLLKQAGGTIWAQDEASCVIYGMPMAVAKAGLVEKIIPLDAIGPMIFDEAG
ncbi:MAG: chemotaxis response regulator protein-glutamate methylesterase [Oleispira antarctica]|nr:chemotaxis response regulator protein-glutamate methylesterase [Oleispira antarctica]MBQ0790920.1 chemotaxis response regulator protein-glutamate methylesterase [Oleispira antarctica]